MPWLFLPPSLHDMHWPTLLSQCPNISANVIGFASPSLDTRTALEPERLLAGYVFADAASSWVKFPDVVADASKWMKELR